MTQIIQHFYSAFANIDAEEMIKCNHKDIVFSDPAFGKLYRDKTKAKVMRKMLLSEQNKEVYKLHFDGITGTTKSGSGYWKQIIFFQKPDVKSIILLILVLSLKMV